MISFGKSITSFNDELNRIPISTIAQKIKNPKSNIMALIEQLRLVSTIDKKVYRSLKVRLPYLVAAVFSPGIRKIENFAFADYFILDIDHLHEKQINQDELFKKITDDNRVVLSFRSPSNDGIKVFFKFLERIMDAGKYSMYYKAFAQKFSVEYNLEQVVDKRTSDVSRACFVSYDSDVFFNEDAEAIDFTKIIDLEDEQQVYEINRHIVQSQKQITNIKPEKELRQVLPDDTLQKIREKLNPNIKVKREKKIFVPEELEIVIETIKSKMTEFDILPGDIKNINYGKQFMFRKDILWAQINLFYGKRGYTIVKTTKSGSNDELADICSKIIAEVVYG